MVTVAGGGCLPPENPVLVQEQNMKQMREDNNVLSRTWPLAALSTERRQEQGGYLPVEERTVGKGLLDGRRSREKPRKEAVNGDFSRQQTPRSWGRKNGAVARRNKREKAEK